VSAGSSSPGIIAQVVVVTWALIINWVVLLQEQKSVGRTTWLGIACTLAVLLLPFWGILVPTVLLNRMNLSSGSEPFAATSLLFAGSLAMLGAGPILSFKTFGIPTRIRLMSLYFLLGVICVYFTDKLANEMYSG
jgi:hypothetical protein